MAQFYRSDPAILRVFPPCLLTSSETRVAVPDFQSLMRPCLAVHQDRQPHTPTDLRDRLAGQMHVSDEDRAVMLPSGRQPVFSNRVAWAVTHLAQAGLLDRPVRGVTQITDRGSEVLKRYPDRVDMKVLRQFPEYEEFRARTKQRKGQSLLDTAKDNGISREDLSPREAIEDVIDSAHSAVAADLLARVLKQSPAFLEQLVLRLAGEDGIRRPGDARRALGRPWRCGPGRAHPPGPSGTRCRLRPGQALHRSPCWPPGYSSLRRGTPRRPGHPRSVHHHVSFQLRCPRLRRTRQRAACPHRRSLNSQLS